MTINNRYIPVNNLTAISNAVAALHNQQVIAYPTEAVFGLGCDPMNETAVLRLLTIKQRPIEKGLILIAANLAQLEHYVDLSKLTVQQIERINQTWPGPATWVMPAKAQVPKWLTGQFDSIAVRVSAHPTVQRLCLAFGGPITSTSANLTGLTPCVTTAEVTQQLAPLLGAIVDETVGELAQPTTITDAVTGRIYR
ncbi:L-threonylcarbamoyladenylate synthase [Moritella dasanensis]|jgi:L-threonylcarbamoyladenylate synthase|uniref:L-threonylcarbamoyladenylate synthase n=1 Tax=Moritella dasanensis TaxID=428031 RepID=UPI000377F247|nr:L-threonylcarbamoyladenylate synthase [Moritella dasanensis]